MRQEGTGKQIDKITSDLMNIGNPNSSARELARNPNVNCADVTRKQKGTMDINGHREGWTSQVPSYWVNPRPELELSALSTENRQNGLFEIHMSSAGWTGGKVRRHRLHTLAGEILLLQQNSRKRRKPSSHANNSRTECGLGGS